MLLTTGGILGYYINLSIIYGNQLLVYIHETVRFLRCCDSDICQVLSGRAAVVLIDFLNSVLLTDASDGPRQV